MMQKETDKTAENSMPNRSTPPAARSELGLAFTEAQTKGTLVLQQCNDCQAVQYPPREVCSGCLSDQLEWQPVEYGGLLLAVTDLHHSHEPYFQDRMPWCVASVKLDCGPIAFVHISNQNAIPDNRVNVFSHIDSSGQAVLIAATASMDIDKQSNRNALLAEIRLNHNEQA